MDANSIDHLRQLATTSDTVAKLQKASRELLGGALLFPARSGDEVIEIHPIGNEGERPEFCQPYRSSVDGLECCTTCRSLMAFGACYRGSLEYSCHGGVRILTDAKRRIALSLVEIAAALIDDLLGRPNHKQLDPNTVTPPTTSDELNTLMASALYLTQTQSAHSGEHPHRNALAERVQEMI